ncbi:MAG: basic amino acid/polyamine antiporter [Prevotellaceae bacterium]|jgi:arginine:ornithine antiporter/lysine permease|nr:basic amino acid/polyamine antiporter [Prevotellaceae bacterium]
MKKFNKLSLVPLIFLILGAMIGSGFSDLPANMAKRAGSLGILLAWVVTGAGILTLVLVYRNLSLRKPDLNSGIASYARAGFGDYIGFNSAWGYWLSAVCANASYFVIIFNTLAYFFPEIFERDHLTIAAFIGGTAIIWFIQYLVCKGVRRAVILNVVVQIAKFIPILLFLVILLAVFNIDKFSFDFFSADTGLGNIGTQIKSIMLVTVWVFIGIEGAIVISERAKIRKDIGRATIIAMVCALLIYMLISLLTFGYMSQQEAAALNTPSTAYILEQIVGPWGAAVVNIGLVISVLGAMLGWTILAAEVIYMGAKDRLMPKIFAKENRYNAPVSSLLLTNSLSQVLLIIAFLSSAAYEAIFFISTTAILLPYLLSGMYGMKLPITGETYVQKPKGRKKDIIIATLCTIYAIWLVYAAGIENLLVVSILYAPGILLYAKVRKENSKKVFSNPFEIALFAVITVMAVIAAVMLITGEIVI